MGFDEDFDVIVIGAGHAGCEAASAAARMGAQTALVTLSLDLIGQMSCNPAIGGIAKGHIVREIDALGGIMGRVIDRTGIQFRLLNRSRGPAVQAPRAQADRSLYRTEMRYMLENTPNLHLRQGLVIDLVVKNGQVCGIELQDTRRFHAKAVIVATGTFLNGLIHTGRRTYSAGLAPQPADERPVPFSFATEKIEQPQITCFIGYTNESVHNFIRANLHESPLYSGQIKGVGPRYCPSIEDKVVKFPDKTRHQLFLEPEGHTTNEIYLNGFSTSLPAELQQDLVRQIPGLEETCIIRPGYAIEYDFVDPRELTPSLQTTRVQGLFFAGQINGTTGYEEAACQGFIAGVNSALYVQDRDSFVLKREEAYIGVLISDLITYGVDEPYRMFTSRAEHRLTLRHDNADIRLYPHGRQLGLINDSDWDAFNNRRDQITSVRNALTFTKFKRSDPSYNLLAGLLNKDLGDTFSLSHLVHYPNIQSNLILDLLPSQMRSSITLSQIETAVADLLYKGYISNQQNNIERLNHQDTLPIPPAFNFKAVSGLSHEMVERFERVRPSTFGQARRVPGVTPGALSTLLFNLKTV